jgi:hypothetical protein
VHLLTFGVGLTSKGQGTLRAVDDTTPHTRSLKGKASLESLVHAGGECFLRRMKRHSLLRENL